MKSFHILLLALLLCFANNACQKNKIGTDTYPNEPDGFRDIKWGEDISNLRDFREVKHDSPDIYSGFSLVDLSNNKIYIRENEKLSFGDARVERIRYHTSKGKLVGVAIQSDDWSTFSTLRDALFQKYGDPRVVWTYWYEWKGGKTNIHLHYVDKSLQVGHFKVAFQMVLSFEDAKHVLMVGKAREDMRKQQFTVKHHKQFIII